MKVKMIGYELNEDTGVITGIFKVDEIIVHKRAISVQALVNFTVKRVLKGRYMWVVK